jgi:predicted MFS family arabinose efflux permease
MAALGSRAALRAAWAERSFVLLTLGFFVCGFHVAFLATHLPGVVAACGLSPQWAGWALAVLGGCNIAGSLAMGWAVGRWRMKSLLALVYALRALAVLIFLVAPKTGPVLLIFAAVMGLTFLSTVPPTAGLVAKFFGVRHMAMLFGITMLSHQVGGFLGAWLGGVLFEASGGYTVLWLIDAGLAIVAALLHLPIREAPVVRRLAPAPA